MGQTRQARSKRQNSGGESATRGNDRNPIDGHPARAQPYANLLASKSMGQDAPSKGLALPSLPTPPGTGETAHYPRLRLKALAALEFLCENENTPANVRGAVARTLLEVVGVIGPKAKHEQDQGLDGLDPEQMTLADIDREIARLGVSDN